MRFISPCEAPTRETRSDYNTVNYVPNIVFLWEFIQNRVMVE